MARCLRDISFDSVGRARLRRVDAQSVGRLYTPLNRNRQTEFECVRRLTVARRIATVPRVGDLEACAMVRT